MPSSQDCHSPEAAVQACTYRETAHLVHTAVLHNLRAQVAALDGAQVLLVGLAVARVLV